MDNLFILSPSGEVLIEKHWRGHAKRTVCDFFLEKQGQKKNKYELPPIITTAKHYLVHVVRFDLTFLTTVTKETSPLLVLELQNHLADIMVDYFKALGETKIRENFTTVYQLLDEVVDGGFASTTELNQLKGMIVPPSLAGRLMQNISGEFGVKKNLPAGAITKIPWRKADVKYVTNEIYFDIVESIDCVINASQQTIRSTIYGEIQANCRLSGTPDLTLSFTNPSIIADAGLHRCVRINRFLREQVLSFVPPDGNFQLCTYKVEGPTQNPLYVKPTIDFRPGSGKVHVMMGEKNCGGKAITDIVVLIPLPRCTRSTSLIANCGTVRYDPKTKTTRWELGKLPSDRTPVLEGTVTLNPDVVPDESVTVSVEFQCKMFAASGLKVDGLAIRGVPYKPFKGVRSLTKHGHFQIRI